MNKSKYNHLKSVVQIILHESITRRYIVLNPIFDQIDEILKSFFNIYIMKNLKNNRLVVH